MIARSERALWKLYLVDPYYGSLGYAGYGDWTLVEGRCSLLTSLNTQAPLGLMGPPTTSSPAGARNDYHGTDTGRRSGGTQSV